MKSKRSQIKTGIRRRATRRERRALRSNGAPRSDDLHWEYEALVRAQTELEVSRDRYADLYDSAPVGYLTLNRAGCILEINLTGTRFLDAARTHLIGRPLLLCIAKSDRKRYLQHLARCRRQNEESRVELALARKPGQPPMFVELVSLPAALPEMPATFFKSVLVDITARKQAEEELWQAHVELERRVKARTIELTQANDALSKSEMNLNDFFDQSPLALLWVARNGRIQRANKAALELLGVTAGECVGRSLKEFTTDSEPAAEALRRLGRGETLQNHRMRLHHRDGSLRHVLVDANAMRDQQKLHHSRWFVRDITYRLKLEKEILATNERVQQRIGRDLHDGVCQELTGIKYRARLLEEKLVKRQMAEGEDARAIEMLLNHAIEQARSQAHGLNPVRLDAGGLGTALRELAANVTEMFNVKCSCSLARSVQVPDLETAIHFYRIAQEAISNAIKHGRARHVRIQLAERGREIRLTIEDDGMGLPAASKKKSGMGLHIMGYRARAVGATLDVRNGTGGGAVVTCSLPGGPV